MQSYHTHSSSETDAIGIKIGKAILGAGAGKTATIVTLSGELGAGKTTLIKGIYKGLGSKARVTSPTFIIMRRSVLKNAGAFKNVFHIDAYRLASGDALATLGVQEIFSEPANIVLLEWPERVVSMIPKDAIKISLRHGKKESEREMKLSDLAL
jgi:tRNA threonylcarbamoyladenosine biosynthesis protein TsaE